MKLLLKLTVIHTRALRGEGEGRNIRRYDFCMGGIMREGEGEGRGLSMEEDGMMMG